MALSANTVFEVRTAGNDTNGGGFVTGASGSDYSLQDNKNTGANDKSTTDAVANGSTTITSATANFQTTIVGNIIYLAGGSGAIAAVRRQVTARASTTSITVDGTVASSTGLTMNIGGALLSPAIATAAALVAGQKIYIKAGTYSITSASTNIAGGCLAPSARIVIEGYNASRGDLGTPPLLQASGIATATLVAMATGPSTYINFSVDGASLTSIRGITTGVQCTLFKLSAINCTNSGFFFSNTGPIAIGCYTSGCSTAGAGFNCSGGSVELFGCVATTNTVSGFSSSQITTTYTHCIADNNSGATSDGFAFNAAGGQTCWNCTAYNNGRSGFKGTANDLQLVNCISESNASFGFDLNAGLGNVLVNCASFGNTDTNGTFPLNVGFVTGGSSFFVNAAGGDFSLNDTAGAGLLLRGTGYPGVFPGGLSTGYLDYGAVQRNDPVPPSVPEMSAAYIG